MEHVHPIERWRKQQAPEITRAAFGRRLATEKRPKGVTETTVWRWENGHRVPERDLLQIIYRETGIPIAELLEASQ